MTNVFEITTNREKDYTLLIRLDEDDKPVKCQPYVVAWHYEPESQTWAQGHYFDEIKDAVAFLFS